MGLLVFLQPGIEHQQNISSPSDAQWKNAKPFKDIPGPRGPPYIGQLYHYKWSGEPPGPPYIGQLYHCKWSGEPPGPPYIGQLYHYKWTGKPHEPPYHAYIAQTIR